MFLAMLNFFVFFFSFSLCHDSLFGLIQRVFFLLFFWNGNHLFSPFFPPPHVIHIDCHSKSQKHTKHAFIIITIHPFFFFFFFSHLRVGRRRGSFPFFLPHYSVCLVCLCVHGQLFFLDLRVFSTWVFLL